MSSCKSQNCEDAKAEKSRNNDPKYIQQKSELSIFLYGSLLFLSNFLNEFVEVVFPVVELYIRTKSLSFQTYL